MNRAKTGRMKVVIRGAVQGVGFRPFVYRLATRLHLTGWVINSVQGLFIEVEGERPTLDDFLLRLQAERPPRSVIQSIEYSVLDAVGYDRFEILFSEESGEKTTLILPDIGTCEDCLSEIFDPQNRRYRYPFTNCTNCGPRYSIIRSLPYDRRNTSMSTFTMCKECQREYDDPTDRRFHAQPNACSVCGPHLELWDVEGGILATHADALIRSAELLRQGKIVALKGIGGFQLLCDARNTAAVQRLRTRKHREEKPLAMMADSLPMIQTYCMVSKLEKRLLLSPESPIVLLKRRHAPGGGPYPSNPLVSGDAGGVEAISDSIAGNNPNFGFMLPYTPLHHILMRELQFPVVATSGNISDEPISTDEFAALTKLNDIADCFLVHNRPIVRHVDDSVVRILLDREQVLRRARGYAPLPVTLDVGVPRIIALGAHLKNTIALSVGKDIFISQHIGDLETAEANAAFRRVISDFLQMYDVAPEAVVCDLHPDYMSTKHARALGTSLVKVQHHYAHVLSCMAENELNPPVLGVSWDGTGYGPDGKVWGGEFLLVHEHGFERIAHLREFSLPGGEAAIKQPCRTAIGLLYEMMGDRLFDHDTMAMFQLFTPEERNLLRQVLSKGINSPRTTSAGRLFDAVASITGVRQQAGFEGQAAMELEYVIGHASSEASYDFSCDNVTEQPAREAVQQPAIRIDWEPMIAAILNDVQSGVSTSLISCKFHNTLAEMIVAVTKRAAVERVVLSGGCFQNMFLTERVVERLCEEHFRPYWHQRVPPNDGGIALGQILAAVRGHQTENRFENFARGVDVAPQSASIHQQ